MKIRSLFFVAAAVMLSGCETTNSIPYKASTDNIIAIQQALGADAVKVRVGDVRMADGVEAEKNCRLMGPVKVAPGKTMPEYIRDAMVEELFAAQAYDTNAATTIDATVSQLDFSSISPASWEVTMAVSSNASPGYEIAIKYDFNTSFSAYKACQNVADAFGPAVQELLGEVINHDGFAALAGGG